ncbi:MAG: D-sedoheptulose 7-phosphate isomerase [Bacillota bacterium]
MNEITVQIEQSIDYLKRVLASPVIVSQISVIAERICRAYKDGKKLLLFGNGGSAADAQHLAAEMVSRFRLERKALPALALTTNSSVVTAIGNDYEYAVVFARQVEALAEPGDIVIGISTSGNSENVRLGLAKAREKGACAVGLLGNEGGRVLKCCDIALVIPGTDTPRIQEAHILLGHILCDLVEKSLFGQ